MVYGDHEKSFLELLDIDQFIIIPKKTWKVKKYMSLIILKLAFSLF